MSFRDCWILANRNAIRRFEARRSPYKYIIDVDGFCVNGKFVCKELGILDCDFGIVTSHHFRVGSFDRLSDADKRQARWLTEHLHGLRFADNEDDEHQDRVLEHVRKLAAKAARQGRFVGYKGGIYELKYLRDAGFAQVASDIHCRKFEELVASTQLPLVSCGRHQPIWDPKTGASKTPHCPKMEILCFYEDLANNNPYCVY